MEDKDLEALIEERATALAAVKIKEADEARAKADLLDRITALEACVKAMAGANAELASSVVSVEEGQLSPQARNRVLTYSAGGGTIIGLVVQGVRWLMGL